jgi:molecular chaperone DnaK (HSP70)
MTVVIKRNRKIPTKQTVTLPVTRFPKNQSEINIKIYEGEHPMTKDNRLLGSFQLSITSLKFGGAPEIDITFDIDANSTLQVKATEHNTENENRITIIDKEILSEAEAEMCKKDQFQRDRIQAKKSLESFCLKMKVRLNDKNLGDKIDGHTKKKTLNAIEFRLAWLETNQVGVFLIFSFTYSASLLAC